MRGEVNLFTRPRGFGKTLNMSMLQYYGLTGQRDRIKAWYNGYLFGNSQVYNPWSVANYVKALTVDPNELPVPDWANTGANNIVKSLVEKADIFVELSFLHGLFKIGIPKDGTGNPVCHNGYAKSGGGIHLQKYDYVMVPGRNQGTGSDGYVPDRAVRGMRTYSNANYPKCFKPASASWIQKKHFTMDF